MKKKIIIVNSREIYGGTLVLSALSKTLTDLGYDARIFYVHDFPTLNTNMPRYWCHWFKYFIKSLLYPFIKHTKFAKSERFKIFKNKPIKGIKEKKTPFITKNTIVIYPEIIYGNFLNAKFVVRWLLYYNRYSGDKNAFGKNDLVVSFRDVFNDEVLNPHKHIVKINHFDSELYKQYNFGERDGCCYIIRKGCDRNDLPSSYLGPIIDNHSEEGKVDILNNCKYCYIYDTQTFYSKIAAICGCIPIVIPEKDKSREDYLGPNYIKLSYGIAYGNTTNEIERAIETRHLLLESLNYKKTNEENATRLIELINHHYALNNK